LNERALATSVTGLAPAISPEPEGPAGTRVAPAPAAATPPVVGQPTSPRPVLAPGITAAVGRLLDAADQFLARLPHSQFTDFLVGALLLVRRSLGIDGAGGCATATGTSDTSGGCGPGLGNSGADLNADGTAPCVADKNCAGKDLTGVDLFGQNLSGVNFTGANLASANLRNATLVNAKLVEADLTGANLSGANFAYTFGTDLARANLTNANLTGANLTAANLTGATVTGANLTGATLRTATLSGLDLAGRNFSGADLSYTDLIGANLTGANLTNANLTGADLQAANFTQANLYGADLTAAKLGAKGGSFPVVLKGADLGGADLRGADLRTVDLTGTNLRAANLTGADLRGSRPGTGKDFRGVDLSYTKLSGAILSGVKLAGANLNGADLSGVDLGGYDLTGVSARDAKLTNANLRSANLSRSDLTFADLTGANLTDANLAGANLSNGKMIGATLTGADLHLANLRYADFTGVDLAGRNFSGYDLIQATFVEANLTGASLTGASLMRANLTGANLTLANLTAAKMVGSVLTNARWDRTTCPDGEQSSAGCGTAAPLQTAPPPGWGVRWTAGGRNGKSWYQYRPSLLATAGAPLTNRVVPYEAFKNTGKDDGVQGTITNSTNKPISVRVYITAGRNPEFNQDANAYLEAVLLPGASMPYRMETWGVDGKALKDHVYTLAFFRFENGQAVGADGVSPSPSGATRLYLFDPYTDPDPRTRFAPPGQGWVNYRSDIKEGASNSEIWDLADGRVNLSVKREYDGWTLEPSKEFLDREWFGTEPNDYAIFTINVVSL
jgi:uncharacterized protein YjbI with pentapeptide repeats